MADLYIVLYDAILEGKAGHGRDGYYFGENGHYLFKDVSAKIGEALYDLGVSETPEPNAFTEEEYKQTPPVRASGWGACYALLIKRYTSFSACFLWN